MPHTLLVSFSLLALVVTARPIVPVSDHSQPAGVQSAIKAIFEERTKQSTFDPFGFTQDHVDIHLISDEGQQAVLSQLDGGAIKALVPLEGTENGFPPEVQSLREMLGGSSHLDDIEGTFSDEPTNNVDISAHAVDTEELPPSELTFTSLSPWESARVLTRLSLTSILAMYTFISLAAVLYAFYVVRGFLVSRREVKKPPLCPGEVASGHADEKTATQGRAPDVGPVLDRGSPQASYPPTGVLVDINEDVLMAEDRCALPRATQSEAIEKPWLVPLPPSPTSSPLWRTARLEEVVSTEGSSQPAWAMVASDAREQRRPDAPAGNPAVAVDLAFVMQMGTGFGVAGDAAWLMRFVMALFGWVAMLVGGGGERQPLAGGQRRLVEL